MRSLWLITSGPDGGNSRNFAQVSRSRGTSRSPLLFARQTMLLAFYERGLVEFWHEV